MTIRKRGEKFFVEIRLKNQPSVYKTFNTKREAERFELEYRHAIDDGPITLKKTFGDACQRYIDEIVPKHKGQRWERLRIEKYLREPIAQDPIQLISAKDIEGIIAIRKKSGLKNGSILRELTILSSIFKEAIRWRYCYKNPVKEARKPSSDKSRKRRILQWEIDRICQKLDYSADEPIKTTKQAVAAAFLFAIETGMRQGEIYKMEWGDVHFEECFVELFETKNGDDRLVPLSDKAISLLHQLKPIRRSYAGKDRVFPFNQASSGTLFRKILKEAGIEDLHFHDTRHEACSRLAKIKGMTALTLGKITGHRDPRSLMIYFNPTGFELAQAIRQGIRY